MACESEAVIISGEAQINFETVLDESCRALESKQALYSLKRIREFDERLEIIEHELDDFLNGRIL